MAADNLQRDFFAVAAHKSETQVNLLASLRPGGCLSLPFLTKTKKE